MKKKYLIGLLVVVACFVLAGCSKTELDKIAKIFNKCETVKKYKEYGYELKATVKENELTVSTKNSEETTKVVYKLDGNILSNEKIKTTDLMSAIILIDSIGKYSGYEDGELAENLNAFPDEFSNYTIEKEGFEMVDNDDTVSIKIDISKKIPLIDMSNFYLKSDTFEMIKQIVEEKSVGNETGRVAKLAYDIQVNDDYNYIYIGEKEELTESAYKSTLSALEVLYGKEESDKFELVYPSFKDKETTVDEFTIETNHKMDVEEDSIFKDLKVVLVTIDNSKVNN